MEFRVHFFPSTGAVPRRTKMHLNGIGLIETEFSKITDHLLEPPVPDKIDIFQVFATRE